MQLLTVVDGIGPPAARGVDIIYRLQCELASLGVDVHILTIIDFLTPPNWPEWMKDESLRTGIHFHVIDRYAFRQSGRLGTPLTRLAYAIEVFSLFRYLHFDIVHEYSSVPILFYRTGLYKQLLGVHAFHTICVYNKKFYGSPRFWGGAKYLDRAICSSRHLKEELISHGCPPNLLSYISYGVDADRFQGFHDRQKLRKKWGLPSDRPIVLFVGPIEDHKGAYDLAKAITKIASDKDVAFLIVTHRRVPCKQHLKNRERFLEMISPVSDHVVILESLVDIPSAMAVSDIVVLPLKTGHGTAAQPLTLLEAMAAGMAIVVSAIDGVVELIRDGENGLLYEPGDVVGLVNALEQLILNQDLCNRLGNEASKKVEGECDIPVIASRLMTLYENSMSHTLKT